MSDFSAIIAERAREFGADIVGFADIGRFSGADPAHDPRRIFPQARSVIGLGFRMLRGAMRGIEEGSTYYQYTTMAIESVEEVVIPRTLLRLSGFLEDSGWEAVPQRRHPLIMAETDATNPEQDYRAIVRGVTGEVQMDFRQAAIACGLGEIGLSGSVLTDRFGPLQRFCFILTNAPLTPDPIPEPHLCDGCGECMAACPGGAYSGDTESVSFAGRQYPVRRLDTWQCAAYYKGASRGRNPFMPPDAYAGIPGREAILRGEYRLSPEEARRVMDATNFYPPPRHGLVQSICGRACDRACYVHLEGRHALQGRFNALFRQKQEWRLREEN
ncbi:MAG: 4Fe-4S binding protein [Clostridiales bacterium]|nr:4Fe-4S binding protein [Clostridiales bacterium]